MTFIESLKFTALKIKSGFVSRLCR